MDCNPAGSSVYGIQARILEWVAVSFSRRSSQPRDRIQVSCIGRWILYHWATWEAPLGTLEMPLTQIWHKGCHGFTSCETLWELPELSVPQVLTGLVHGSHWNSVGAHKMLAAIIVTWLWYQNSVSGPSPATNWMWWIGLLFCLPKPQFLIRWMVILMGLSYGLVGGLDEIWWTRSIWNSVWNMANTQQNCYFV